MTKVTFENATIRDVIGKAARIAPNKRGDAFDKAAGILVQIDPTSSHVIVKSTNLDVFYMEIVDTVSIEADGSVNWLLPSSLLDGVCSKLPVASGANVTFESNPQKDGRRLKIAHSRMRATLHLMDPTYYPEWGAFSPEDLSVVENLGARLNQVMWAASKSGVPPITGINLDGRVACATDKYRIAITPCEIPNLYESLTIPAASLVPVMKNLGEVRIGQEQGTLLLMPDDTTQIKTVIYAQEYPKIQTVIKRDESHVVAVTKDHLLDMVDQAMVIGAGDRNPMLKMIIGLEELAVMMEDQEMGLLGNVLELPGQCTHDRAYIGFTPDNLVGALRNAPNDEVHLWYTPEKVMKPVRIDGGSGYESLIMPRNLNRSSE